MRFNIEQYRKYREAAGKPVKDGIWDVTAFPNGLRYPLTWEVLDYHGKVKNHDLLGTRWEKLKTGETYEIDNVCYHWDKGYYIHVTLRREGTKSHGTAIPFNINSQSSFVEECVTDFHKKFKEIKS